MKPPETAATIFVPSAEEATHCQVLADSRAVQARWADMPRIYWPSFWAIFQPPVPFPTTSTMSPTSGAEGRVIVTWLVLLATYPVLGLACWEVPVTSSQLSPAGAPLQM